MKSCGRDIALQQQGQDEPEQEKPGFRPVRSATASRSTSVMPASSRATA